MTLDNRRQDTPTISLIINSGEDEEYEVGEWVEKLHWMSLINNGYMIRARISDVNHSTISELVNKGILSKARNEQVNIAFRIGWSVVDKTLEHYTEYRYAVISRLDIPRIGRTEGIIELEAMDPASWILNHGDCFGGMFKGRIGGFKGAIHQCADKYLNSDVFKNPTKKKKSGIFEQFIRNTAYIIDDIFNFEDVARGVSDTSGLGRETVRNENIIGTTSEDRGVQSFRISVGDTDDNPDGRWYMMRLDPRTFIVSLMEWSASITKKKTPWIVQSQDDEFIIKEVAELKPPNSKHPGVDFNKPQVIVVNTNGNGLNEVKSNKIELINNSHLTVVQKNLFTAGISTVTGKYIDKKTMRDSVITNDENTQNKLNASFDGKHGFDKPNKNDREWSTFIKAIPEHNNGDVGQMYWDYLSGRARDYFMKMLYTVMRCRITVVGDPKYDDIKILGPTKINLDMNKMREDDTPELHMMGGEWMIYGFHHIVTNEDWETKLYLSRLDWNALAKGSYKGNENVLPVLDTSDDIFRGQ